MRRVRLPEVTHPELYNIGVGAFGASSVCRLTRLREFMRAAASFLLWNKAGGRVIPGLALRHAAERLVYLRGI
jgi:lysozyme